MLLLSGSINKGDVKILHDGLEMFRNDLLKEFDLVERKRIQILEINQSKHIHGLSNSL